MNRRTLLALMLACLGLAGWLLLARAKRTDPTELVRGAQAAAPTAEPVPSEAGRAGGAEQRVPVEKESSTEAPQPIASAAPAPVVVDKRARDWVNLIVQDRLGAPVPNAEINMVGMRTKRDPRAHYAWPTEPSLGRTAADGTGRIWYPVWVTPDDEAGKLTFKVSPPDFVTRIVDDFDVGAERRVIVLERGAFVIVSGWIESASERILDVEPLLTEEVKLPGGAWQRIRDGRLSTANIQTGAHAIYLRHADAEKGLWFSAVTPFSLAEAEQKELHLQLLPATRLEGRLEDEVPRPVLNGTVLLNLLVVDRAGGPVTMMREFRAPIRADGTFALPDLPPGDGQIIALCDGWASERVGDPGTPDDERIAQKVDPASGGIFVLKMEPTASLKATLRDPQGKPVEGAFLSCWPNVQWLNGYSSTFLGQSWSATSDARGEVVVANIPCGTVWYGVAHRELDLEMGAEDRTQQADLQPGKTLEVVLDLVAKEK